MCPIVSDRDLVEFARCPIRVADPEAEHENGVYYAAVETAKAAVLSSFYREKVSHETLLHHYDKAWKVWLTTHDDFPAKSVEKGIKAVSLVRDLLSYFQVSRPFMDYRLVVDGFSTKVSGNYATVSASADRHTSILCLTDGAVVPYPSVASLCQWLHAFRTTSHRPVGSILFYSVTRSYWTSSVAMRENVALRTAKGVLSAYLSQPGYPSPGVHCDSCKNAECINLGEPIHG